MDGVEGLVNLIELLIFLLFILARPIGRFLRKNAEKNEQKSAPPERPQRPAPTRQPAPQPVRRERIEPAPDPVPAPDIVPTNPLARSVSQLQAEADRFAASSARSRLAGIPSVEVLSRWLSGRQGDAAEAATRALDRARAEVERSPTPSGVLVDAIEEAQVGLRDARNASQLEDLFATQRRNPSQRKLLGALDAMAGACTAPHDKRERWSLLWDGSPLTPPALAGAGRIGVVPLRAADARSGAGTVYLARGLGFDVLGSSPTAADEIRDAAMVGPLAGARWSHGFSADHRYDAVQSIAAWAPHLYADLVGARVLGFRYAMGLVDVDVRAGLRAVDATSIVSRNGRYGEEPPLIVRLAAIESVVQSGAASDVSAVGYLEQRLPLPEFLQYYVAGGGSRRLDREALLGLVRDVGEGLAGARVEGLGGSQISEMFPAAFRAVSNERVRKLIERLRAGDAPGDEPLGVWLAAIEGEATDLEAGRNLLGPLVRALGPKELAPAAIAAARAGAVSDRALIRQAYVLSEIL